MRKGFFIGEKITPFPTYTSGTEHRITTIEKLTRGNPAPALYSIGYQLRATFLQPSRPTRISTVWMSGAAGGVMNTWTEHFLDGIPGSVRHETVSTRIDNAITRTITLKTTETIQQPAVGNAVPTTQEIITKSSETRQMFAWGEETIEATTYPGNSLSNPWTTHASWYDNVTESNPNYATVRLKRQPGAWQAFFAGVPDIDSCKSSGSC